MKKKRPHILFIMSDQFRYDALGCHGNEVIQTPNYDRLAESGVRFTNAYTPNPICVPARASLTTGCYPHKCIGTKENEGAIMEGFPLLGEELNKRGYSTYAIGKLHYLPYMPPGQPRTTHGIQYTELVESGRILANFDPKGEQQGLEDYHDYLASVGWGGYTRAHGLGANDIYLTVSPIPEEHYVDGWVATRAIHHMKRHIEETDQPFFMWASFPKPHPTWDPPRPYDVMYDPRAMPDPIGDISMIKDRQLDLIHNRHFGGLHYALSPEALKMMKAYYYGLISYQDKQVGRMLDFLEEYDLRENTVVVFVSDHGEMLGDLGLFSKMVHYNGSVRIPMMISYPQRFAAGQVSDELVGLQDLLPTLLGLTGEPLEAKVDGIDITSVLTDQAESRRYYVSQCYRTPRQEYMVASKEYKYIYHQHGGVEELYDQRTDLHEMRNLVHSDEPEIQRIQKEMRQYLYDWCLANGDSDMLDKGELVSRERVPAYAEPPTGPYYPFGRRFY